MKKPILLIVLSLVIKFSFAQGLEKENKDAIQSFIECVKNDNLDKLKTLINYPLERQYPIPSVKNEEDFENQYATVFDDSLKSVIINSNIDKDWADGGWRGVMLNRGILWFDGKLISLSYQSDLEKELRIQLIEKDKKSIHESINNFEEPISIIKTSKYLIRIDKLSTGKFRYISWSIESKMKDKPDLILTNGNISHQEISKDYKYEFVNGQYKYECIFHPMGEISTPPVELIVYKKDKELVKLPGEIKQF